MKIKRKKNISTLPFFSSSDIAFLLLIFVMMVSLINYRNTINIQYAHAQSAESLENEAELEIWIDNTGNYFFHGHNVSLEYIQNEILGVYNSDFLPTISLVADKDTAYKNVNDLLQILQILQYKYVNFIVRAVLYE